MSLVHTAAVSPYSTELASSMIASSSRHENTDSTGPKISSRAIFICGCTSPNTVGSTQKPRSNSLPGGRLPPIISLAPSSTPDLIIMLTRSMWRLEFIGPICDFGIHRVAHLDLGDRLGDAVEHLLVELLMQHQPAGGAAGLSRPREVHAGDGGVGDLVGIGVRIDDERVLAAQLQASAP